MDDHNYVLSVKLIGVMHKEAVKLYMTSVLWSDQNEIVIHRSFKDFKALHKKLKKRFPPENRLKKSDRVVPKFKVKKAKSGKKSPSKSVLKMKSLERYCNELISSDRVAQSAEFRQFFQPHDSDMSSDFGKNSIVILPSEDTLNDGGGGGGGGGNVTQPFVTETYRCVAPYETKDTKNRPFKVDVDELVDVLIKDKAGWWMVQNEAKCMAWFPAPYLEKEDAEFEDETDDNDGVLYCSSRAHKARSADELSVGIGNVVEVLQKSENGWWLVRHNRKTGYMPSMYLSPYKNPRVQLLTSQKDLRGSTLNLSTLQTPQALQHSRSQGNLLQLPGLGTQSPAPGLSPQDRNKSRSLSLLEPESDIYQRPNNMPSIRVDQEPAGRRRSMTVDSEESESSSSSTEFSFSDDDSTSGTESLNMSRSDFQEELRRSRTPPPPSRSYLSPDSGLGGRLQPSRSDPNLAKNPVMPKVPPRPRAQEILKRCTTVTRKNLPQYQLEANDIQSR